MRKTHHNNFHETIYRKDRAKLPYGRWKDGMAGDVADAFILPRTSRCMAESPDHM